MHRVCKIENYPIFSQIPSCCSFAVQPPSPLTSGNPDLVFDPFILYFPECYVNGVTQHVATWAFVRPTDGEVWHILQVPIEGSWKVYIPMPRGSFTQHNVHPLSRVPQFIPFYCWVVFPCMNVSQSAYPFPKWGIFELWWWIKLL